MMVAEYVDGSGRRMAYERYCRAMPLSAFEHGDHLKELCKGCPKQGNNLSCPPYSQSFLDHVGQAREAIVVCIRLSQKYFHDLPPKDRYHACFRQASLILLSELRSYREEGHPIAGSGPCLACERCAAEEGSGTCRDPVERTYSLESLGVDVVKLLKTSFDMELEWNTPEKNSEYICSVGAAFIR